MKNSISKIGLVLFLSILITYSLSAQQAKTVTSNDNLVKVTVPEDWGEMNLNEGASLQRGNEDKSVYLLIINDPKEDIEGWNLKKHSFITLGKLLAGVNSPVIEGPVYFTANGIQGIQYSIKGSVGGQMIIYLHTTFETQHTFSQVLTWTVPSQYDKNKKAMDGVINSFKSAK